MSEKKNKPHLRLRLFAMFLLRMTVLVGPLCTVFAINRERYFATVAEGVSLAIGGGICVLFVMLLVLGVIKPPGALYMFGLVFLLSYLMKPILADLFLLSGIAFCSKLVDFVVMESICRATRARIGARTVASTTVAALDEVLSRRYSGRV